MKSEHIDTPSFGAYETDIRESAAGICASELARRPNDPELLYVRGLLWSSQYGHLHAAIACLRRAIVLQPSSLRYYLDLGAMLGRAGRGPEARDVYLKALTLAPNKIVPYLRLGRALYRLRQLQEAVGVYEEALRLRPDHASTHFALAEALQAQGRVDSAIKHCEAGLYLTPRNPRGLYRLGMAHLTQGQFTAALGCFRSGLSLTSADPDLHVGVGKALFSLGSVDEAVRSFRAALACDPWHEHASRCLVRALDERIQADESANAWFHRGTVLSANKRYQEAVVAFQKATAIKSTHLPALAGLARAHVAVGRPREALELARTVVGRVPEDPTTHTDLATIYHLLGDLDKGWDEFAWLYDSQTLRRRGFERPLWDGSPLYGRTILLWTDMGRGDSIQFLRYVPLIKARGGTVVVECHHPELVPLVERIPGADAVIVPGSPTPYYDVHTPLNFLPAFLKQYRSQVDGIPYITADPALVGTWGRRLGHYTGTTVGLSWGGNAETLSSSSRFVSLTAFAPLKDVPGIRYVSLQHGPQSAELLDPPAGLRVERMMDDSSSVADAAAIVSNMDLVISVDTMIAHLAGAIGRPVWTVLRYATNWRWRIEGEKTAWYPTMRLFRQARLDDWSSVFENLRVALQELVENATVSD